MTTDEPIHINSLIQSGRITQALNHIPDDINALIDGWAPLHCATYYGYIAIVRALIARHADVNVKSEEGFTPLHYAYMEGFNTIALMLRQAGSDINSRLHDGGTLLHFAAAYGDIRLARKLVKGCIDVNAQDMQGCTALHRIFSSNVDDARKEEFACLLLFYGALTLMMDKSGCTAFEMDTTGIIERCLEHHVSPTRTWQCVLL